MRRELADALQRRPVKNLRPLAAGEMYDSKTKEANESRKVATVQELNGLWDVAEKSKGSDSIDPIHPLAVRLRFTISASLAWLNTTIQLRCNTLLESFAADRPSFVRGVADSRQCSFAQMMFEQMPVSHLSLIGGASQAPI